MNRFEDDQINYPPKQFHEVADALAEKAKVDSRYEGANNKRNVKTLCYRAELKLKNQLKTSFAVRDYYDR
jgi:hypothetical protein